MIDWTETQQASFEKYLIIPNFTLQFRLIRWCHSHQNLSYKRNSRDLVATSGRINSIQTIRRSHIASLLSKLMNLRFPNIAFRNKILKEPQKVRFSQMVLFFCIYCNTCDWSEKKCRPKISARRKSKREIYFLFGNSFYWWRISKVAKVGGKSQKFSDIRIYRQTRMVSEIGFVRHINKRSANRKI